MKKITIVGRGTVGCLTVINFLSKTDWLIDWVYDPNIATTPVGEGTTLTFPGFLRNHYNFDTLDLDNIQSTPKLGIWKRGWSLGQDFIHSFPIGWSGLHFNALQFQDYVFNKLSKHPRIKIVESNATNYEDMDSDHVMVCTGSPKNLDDYHLSEHIPVNSAMVFQCPWDYPKFLFSLTFAKKHGWVFGIPLKKRCAIGYLYNKDYCDENEIEKDVQDVLKEFDLKPSTVRKLNFNNYFRKINFGEKVSYNGNASFFLEPLEATSTATSVVVNDMATEIWSEKTLSIEQANRFYYNELTSIETMICLHYFSGSIYKNNFWNYAEEIATKKIQKDFEEKRFVTKIIMDAAFNKDNVNWKSYPIVGSWDFRSYVSNINDLGLSAKLKKLHENTKGK
jgi:hypothetical protein